MTPEYLVGVGSKRTPKEKILEQIRSTLRESEMNSNLVNRLDSWTARDQVRPKVWTDDTATGKLFGNVEGAKPDFVMIRNPVGIKVDGNGKLVPGAPPAKFVVADSKGAAGVEQGLAQLKSCGSDVINAGHIVDRVYLSAHNGETRYRIEDGFLWQYADGVKSLVVIRPEIPDSVIEFEAERLLNSI